MTVKVLYIDNDGVTKELLSYGASEFVTTATPSSPVRTLPSGKLDISLIPSLPAGKAATLVITREAAEDINLGELVSAHNILNKVVLADANTTLSAATALGIALNDALNAEEVEVLVLGVHTDPSYSVFPVNTPLFLDEQGGITDVRPVSPTLKFLTQIGISLGNGEILINISQPLSLGV